MFMKLVNFCANYVWSFDFSFVCQATFSNNNDNQMFQPLDN